MTIDELLAREAIRELIGAYSSAVDGGRFDDVLVTFAEDALLEAPPSARARGHAEIRRYLDDVAARCFKYASQTGRQLRLRHHLTGSLIRLLGASQAQARTSFLVIGPSGLEHSGSYNDKLIRHDERWLLTERKIQIEWTAADSVTGSILNTLR